MKVNVSRMISARKRTGLSQAEFSRRVRISYVSLWRIERRKQTPRADVIGRWADVCGVGVERFYTKAAA